MGYRTRSTRRYVKKSKRNFFVTVILVILIIFATIQWILPTFVNGVGLITGIFKDKEKTATNITESAQLAPPVLNIPYEATNTAEIDVKGYSTPGSRVKLFVDDSEFETIDVSSDGDFTFRKVSLSLGTNNIYAVSIDEKDRESLPSKTFKIVYDNEKPTLSVSEPEDGRNIQGGDRKVKISGKTEPESEIFINDSQVIVDKDGNFESVQSLNDGENVFNIKAVDSASNSTEIVRRVTYQP